MIAAHSGGLGDIVYSIPVMRTLGITEIYVKRNYYFEPYGDLFKASARLLQQAGFIVHPTSGDYVPMTFEPGLVFDYNMDAARNQPRRGHNHIIISYLNQYKLPHTDWTKPWLTVEGANDIEPGYNLIHRTARWREGSRTDWRLLLHKMEGPKYFVGFQQEWIEFCTKWRVSVEWLPCNDILDMAILIRDAGKVFCNQSVSLAISQAMGKEYYCEFKPGKTNCKMFVKNEHCL